MQEYTCIYIILYVCIYEYNNFAVALQFLGKQMVNLKFG